MASYRASNSAMLRDIQASPTSRFTEGERLAICKELERVLASAVFRNSRRYASVLRYIVEQTLEHPDTPLKERTIGIEVFGRLPDYDTASDHVVRSAIAEIRKRLAQYYQEEPRAEVKIELQPGSYVPQFRPAVAGHIATDLPRLQVTEPALVPAAEPTVRWTSRKLMLVGIASSLVITLALVAATRRSAVDRFWAPLLSSERPVLFCIGNLAGGHQNSRDPLVPDAQIDLVQYHELDTQTVHIDDAVTLANIVGFVRARHMPYRIESQSRASYADLQAGPTVLIGLMNNDWTERLVSDLRFSVEHPTPWVYFIRDRENPANHSWSIDYAVPYLSVTKDYAIIVRASDPKTGQMVMTIAGLSVFGTLAAGQFVTDAQQIKKLEALAPKNWAGKNMEVVLSTDVIRGVPGPPAILAARFW